MNRKIKSMLVERGISIRAIAARCGISEPGISGALNGHWKSRRVREAIAKELNLPITKLEKIWETRKAA